MIEVIVAIIGSGVATAIVNWLLNRGYKKAEIEYTHAETVGKLTNNYGELLEKVSCLQQKVEKLEEDRDKLERQLSVMRDKYESSILHNDLLVQRVKMLAKILSRILCLWEEEISLDFLTSDITITDDDREFLRSIVEEANNVCSTVADQPS
jgi:predicted RNase H-like nuclease (RuvC/YqgF family)